MEEKNEVDKNFNRKEPEHRSKEKKHSFKKNYPKKDYSNKEYSKKEYSQKNYGRKDNSNAEYAAKDYSAKESDVAVINHDKDAANMEVLKSKKVVDLVEIAKELKLTGYSDLKKNELILKIVEATAS